MTLTISLPTEIELALRERALAVGLDVETFVTNVVKDEVADDVAMEPRRRMSHEEFRARLQRIIDLHPVSHHFVDDSRESIYAGRGE